MRITAFLLATLFLSLGAAERLLNTVAIMVNNEYATLYDVKKEIAPTAPDSVTDDQIAKRKKEVVEKLVAGMLVRQEIKKRAITISDEDIDHAVQNVAEQNRMTIDQLKKEIAEQGLSWEKYRGEVLRKQLELLSLKRDIAVTTLDVDENTLRDLHKRHFSGGVIYTASHIIIPVESGNADADAYERIADVHRAVETKELSFEEAAERYSMDASARNGGKLPPFRFNEMDAKFSTEVAQLDPGKISRPFRTRFGWHIARLDKAEKSDPPKFEEVRERLRHIFYQTNQDKAFEAWIKGKSATGNIRILF